MTNILAILLLLFWIQGCQLASISELTKGSIDFVKQEKRKLGLENSLKNNRVKAVEPLHKIIESAEAEVDLKSGFGASILAAVDGDPEVIAQKLQLSRQAAEIATLTAAKDFQVSSTVYAGVEDVSDETTGIALVLRANRLLFDGGGIDAELASRDWTFKSEGLKLEALRNQKAVEFYGLWIDLNRYTDLNSQIDDRLLILGPLIEQLERVAEAGIGDVTRVAAAQRTVSVIEASQTQVEEQLEQARLNFINSFGDLPVNNGFDESYLSDLVPNTISQEMIIEAPALKAAYMAYMSSEANIEAVRAKNAFNIGFETSFQRPFGGSGYDSDEQIGIAVRKTLYDGKKIEAEIRQAEADVQVRLSNLRSIYRQGDRNIRASRQKIIATKRAIKLAEKNISEMQEEISYLKQQLIIGGSTIDSVLSAEARLYNVNAQQINHLAEKQKAELAVLGNLGLLPSILNR